MGEFDFIEQIAKLSCTLPSNGYEGIGDDCAVLPMGDGRSLLFTSDLLVEGVHFLREATSAYDLGHKSLAVNLSDVASMGATPTATLLSLSIPKELSGEWIEEFMRGYTDSSRRYGVALIGGDTTSSTRDLTINVTAIGVAADGEIKRRSDAEMGDRIYVTAPLGESGAGLRDILNGEYDTLLATIHKCPTPRVAEGAWLGKRVEVGAMMDISDGIASDLRHIMKRSNVGAIVELSHIPTRVNIEDALCGGEDYELLFTLRSDCNREEFEQSFKEAFGYTPHSIGSIVEGNELTWLENGKEVLRDYMGFRHM